MVKGISSLNFSNPSDKKVKKVTKRFNTDKSKGQHLLRSEQIIQQIVNAGHIDEKTTVLEIGPGTGNLTIPMARKVKFIYAYEVDPLMVKELKRRLIELELIHKVKIINKDFLKANLPKFDKCISNVPYQISSKIVFKLLKYSQSYDNRFNCAIIMFQKEFAERLSASHRSKEYCRLSVCSQLFSKTRFLFKVEKKHFSPPPLVDSGVVKIEPRKLNKDFYEDLFDGLKNRQKEEIFLKCFEFICGIIFGRKNKTINSLFLKKDAMKKLEKNGFKLDKEKFSELLKNEKFEIEVKKEKKEEELGKIRTKSLSVVQIVELVRILIKNGLNTKKESKGVFGDEDNQDSSEEEN